MISDINNPTAPHKALITILIEVHEVLPSGECRGMQVHKDRKQLILTGQDRYITIRRLNELLQEIQSKCQ
jgi:hypothetical protein